MDVQRLADGLWRWTTADAGCVYYEAAEAVVLFDPLLPSGDEVEFLDHLDRDVERLGLPVSILLTAAWRERSAPIVRERYQADDRVPATVDVYPVEQELAYYIRPHRALVVASLSVSPPAVAELPVQLVLPSDLAR
jgi:hypothetical protein